jgi:GNAT superfamily N-acetyltransferase
MNLMSLVLAKHVGSVLTLPLAATIAREVSPSSPLLPSEWAPDSYGAYTLQAERLVSAYDTLRGQRMRYLAETNPGQRNDLTDWDRLMESQRTGEHVIFTARDQAGDIVASLWLWFGPDLDTQRLTVQDDIFYVLPEHRGGMLAVRLWQYAERCMFAIGARDAQFHSRLDNRAQRMAFFLGYTPTATRVKKTSDGDSFAHVPARHTKATQ